MANEPNRTIQICEVNDEKIKLRPATMESGIYKSEIGKHYFQVQAVEIKNLKAKLQAIRDIYNERVSLIE